MNSPAVDARPAPAPSGRRAAALPVSRATGRMVVVAALALVLAQAVVRFRVLAARDYYADDFDLLYLASQSPILSSSYLLHDYVGHFMPGAFLLVGLVERAAPLEWEAALVSLVCMQVLASLALLRLLRVLLGERPLLLVPLALGLFSPLTLGFTTWWAAALNSMPLQIGVAWFLADAVLLSRTGRRRYAVTGTAALAFSLAFYLKAVLVPVAAFGVVVVVLLRDGERAPVRAAVRRAGLLWAGTVAVLACWAVAYVATRESAPVDDRDPEAVITTVTAGYRALAPTVLGGPFEWAIWPPGTPMADLPTGLVVAGAVVVLGAFLWTVVRRRGALTVWLLVAAVVGAGLLMAALGRSGEGLADLAPRTYRYYAIEAVLLPVAVALLATLPRRRLRGGPGERPAGRFPRWAGPATAVATASFVVASLVSTAGYARAWETDRTGAYLATARASLEAAGPAPLLPQPVPSDVLLDWSHPGNLTSRVFAPLPDRPEFASATSDLRVLDDAGRLRPAQVVPGPVLAAGPAGDCGWPARSGGGTAIALTAPVPSGEWTAELRYVAARDGDLVVSLGSGPSVRAPVREGVHTLYVRLTGEGQSLRVAPSPSGPELCVAAGSVGTVSLR